MLKNSSLCLAAVLMIAACGPLGKYNAQAEVREDLYGQGVQTSEENTARIGWKDMFLDAKLQALIEKALAGNLDLEIARENILLAQNSLRGARLAYLPYLGANGTYNYSFANGKTPSGSYDISANASWELDIFYRNGNRIDNAKAGIEQARDFEQGVQVKLISELVSTYYELLMLDEQQRILDEMLATWQKSLDAIHKLKREGFADEVAVGQYEATYAKLQTSSVQLKYALEQTENAMSLLLAEPPCTHDRGTLMDQQPIEAIMPGVPCELLTSRPDVRAAQRDIEKAFYTTKDAWLNFFPTITITGSASVLGLANLAAGIVAPVLNVGQNITRLKSAQLLQEQARTAFDSTLLQAGNEVNNCMKQYNSCKEQIEWYDNQVESLTRARKNTELLMRNSETKTYLDVLAAHNALIEAEFGRVENYAALFQNAARLYAALGGGSDYSE